MNLTVIKQMRYREDQICVSNHYVGEEWPCGDSRCALAYQSPDRPILTIGAPGYMGYLSIS